MFNIEKSKKKNVTKVALPKSHSYENIGKYRGEGQMRDRRKGYEGRDEESEKKS